MVLAFETRWILDGPLCRRKHSGFTQISTWLWFLVLRCLRSLKNIFRILRKNNLSFLLPTDLGSLSGNTECETSGFCSRSEFTWNEFWSFWSPKNEYQTRIIIIHKALVHIVEIARFYVKSILVFLEVILKLISRKIWENIMEFSYYIWFHEKNCSFFWHKMIQIKLNKK